MCKSIQRVSKAFLYILGLAVICISFMKSKVVSKAKELTTASTKLGTRCSLYGQNIEAGGTNPHEQQKRLVPVSMQERGGQGEGGFCPGPRKLEKLHSPTDAHGKLGGPLLEGSTLAGRVPCRLQVVSQDSYTWLGRWDGENPMNSQN